MKLYQKIQEAQKQIEAVQKTRKQGLSYAYQTAEDIAEAVKAVADFAIIPVISATATEQRKTDGGKAYTLATVEIDFLLASEDESLTIRWVGEAADFATGDKALNKAITSCQKQFYRTLFMIPAEDAPEPERKATSNATTQPTRKPQKTTMQILTDYGAIVGIKPEQVPATLYAHDVRQLDGTKVQRYKEMLNEMPPELAEYMARIVTPENKHLWFKYVDENPLYNSMDLAKKMMVENWTLETTTTTVTENEN